MYQVLYCFPSKVYVTHRDWPTEMMSCMRWNGGSAWGKGKRYSAELPIRIGISVLNLCLPALFNFLSQLPRRDVLQTSYDTLKDG